LVAIFTGSLLTVSEPFSNHQRNAIHRTATIIFFFKGQTKIEVAYPGNLMSKAWKCCGKEAEQPHIH